MSNRDLAKSLIDQIPEGKLVFIIPYLQELLSRMKYPILKHWKHLQS